ncbi:MAG: putative peptidoglycan glycosyltransferase FtsW [Lachnospiraceae bacterium]
MARKTNTTQKTRKVRRTRAIQGKYFDYSLLAVIIFLICFGLVMLYSTSAYTAQKKFGDSMYYFKRQALISLGSFMVMLVISQINYHWYAKYAKLLYFVSIILMALVLSPLGIEAYSSRRWIRLPFKQQMQPSEVAKIAIILFIPVLICRMGKEVNSLRGILKVLAWGGASAAGVFFLTDNLSTAIIVFGVTCIMIFVVHPKTAPFIIIVGAGLTAFLVGAQILGSQMTTHSDFRLRRVLVWLHPEDYTDSGGFQITQGLYAIGSGGFFGKGLGNSAQKLILPEVQNDMILSIICEELGVCGAIVVLLLFGMLLYRLLFIAQNAPDLYGSLVVTGIFAHIALQVILNVSVVLNLIPTTGITLPFISYGGTSVLFLLVEMGIALGVSRTIKFDD